LEFATGGNNDIWIWDLVRKTLSRLTFDEASDICPLWTTDGKRIAFASNRDGVHKVYWKPADGTGKDELLGSVPGRGVVPAAWSSDGKTLVLLERGAITETSGTAIGVLPMEGDRKYRPLLKEKYNEVQPQISPNGRWMAYTSDESGQAQIYVRPFPEVDSGRWQLTTSGGDSPLWSRDGRELFYHSGDAIMAVSVKTEPTFSLETPKILFRGTYNFRNTFFRGVLENDYYPWDIRPDGKRFLMMKEPGATVSAEGGPRRINIVLNWFEELKQRVPKK
jgi:Tol biopolymer transport system component